MKHKIARKTPLKVLYLEDSPHDVEIIRELLKDAGYDLSMDCADKKKEYTSLLSERTYDIILSDFTLPGFNAFGALDLAKKICPEVPFICVSGSIGEETAIELIKQGAVDYVLKDRMVRLPLGIKRALDEAKERKSRRQAEEALHESEERYRLLFNSSMDGILLTSPTGEIFSANPAMCNMVRRSEEEICLLGRNGVVDASDPRLAPALEKRLKTGRFSGELTLLHKDGSKFPAEVSTVLFKDKKGTDHTSMIIRDITERKRAEEELIKNEALLSTAVENLPLIFYIIDPNGTFKLSIGAGLKGLGLRPNQVVGQSVFEVYKDFPVITDSIKKSLAGEVVEFESSVAESFFANFLVPFSSVKGIFAGVVGVALDITERKQSQEALRESERQLSSIYNTVGDTIFQLAVESDEKYRFVSVNQAFCNVTGLTEKMVVGKLVNEVIPEPSLSMVLGKYKTAIEENSIIRWEETSDYPAGRLTGDVSIAPVVDDKGRCTHLVGSVHDITERKQAEEKIVKLSRMYRLLSNINQAIVRIHDPQELFSEVCRIPVEAGNFRMAWLGMVNPETQKVDIVASAGSSNDYLSKINIDLKDNKRGQGPTGMAIKSGTHAISNDIEHDDTLLPWREDAARLGYRSSAAFPIKVSGKIWGAFTLYSSESGFFTTDEIKLLDELAMDISFAIEFIQQESERKRAEEKANHLAAIVQSSEDAIIGKNLDGMITSWNKGAGKIYGYTESEVIGKSISILIPPGNEDEMPGILDRLKSGEYIEHYETVRRTKDGREIRMSLTISPIRDAEGKIIAASTIGRDITEHKQAEEKLRKSEEKYRSIFENVQDIYYEVSLDGTLLEVSPSIEIMTKGQYHRDDLVGKSMDDFYSVAGGRQAFLALLRERRDVTDHEIMLKNRDGSYVTCSISAKVFFDGQGAPLKIVGSMRDITERKKAEEALGDSEERYRALVTFSPDPLYVHVDGRVTLVNPAMCKLLGADDPSQLIGKQVLEIVHPEYHEIVQERWKTVFGGRPAPLLEEKFIRIDGTAVDVEVNAVAVDWKGSKGVQVIARDITERKQAEDAIRESEERFRMVFENVFDGISIYSEDPDPSKRRLVECNERYATMAGRSREELLQFGNTLRLQKTHEDAANDNRLKSLTRGTAYQGSFSWIRPDGKENSIEYVGVPIMWRGKPHSIGIDRDITERERTEKQVRLLAHTIKSIGECVSITDMNDNILFVNDAFLATYRYAEHEILGKNISILRSPNNAPDLIGAIYRTARNEGWHGEMLNRAKDGREFPISLSTSIVRDDNGKAVALVGVASDITERKRAEEALTYERNLLRALMDNIPDHVYFKDNDSRFLRISKSQASIFGIDDPSQAIGKTDFDFFAEEHARSAFEAEQKIVKSGIAIVDLEEKESWPDGRQTWASTTKVPFRNVQGEIIGTFGISRDITERKHAEEERQRLITAFEQTAEAILVTDPRGIIRYVNPAFERITGFTREEAIGQNPRIMNSGRQNAGFYNELWKAISTGRKWRGRFINKKKDGTLFTDETSISPVLNEQGEIMNYVGVKRDITGELSLQTQLAQAQKLESIGTLASGIAHDFNNILGIILGHTSLLERLREDSHMHSESVAAIMKATQRGTSLVKQLMLFARKTEPLLEPVKVNNIIGEITKLLQRTFPKTITISASLQQDLPEIVADSSQIHQVLLNLLVNARDAMPHSGTISITTGTVEGEIVSSRFPKATARQYVKVEVADTGIGMDEATRQRIFEPFFTTKGPGKGTGLGLAVVFGIVEYHNGFIDVRTALGEGTSFTVYLPIPEFIGHETQAAGKVLVDIPGGTETILFIEDEEALRSLAKGILVSKGYTVLTAEDGMEGVEMYRSHQKEIAVVVSDIGLPILGGQDVFRKIRAINPEAKVIFASGFFDPDTKTDMYKAGLKDFIQKPYMQDEVLQKIRAAIDSK